MTMLNLHETGSASGDPNIDSTKAIAVSTGTNPKTNPFGQTLDSINETFLSEHEELLISWDEVAIKSVLASGAYGTVSSGLIEREDLIVPVAVKELTWHSLSAAKVTDFEREIEILLSFEHPNIVVTFGACVSPLALVMELMPLGDLRTFLQHRDMEGPVTTLEQKQFYAFQLASGMDYIAKHGVVHRDVAARNCLVGYPTVSSFGMHVLKISDFGLARELPHQSGMDLEQITYIPGETNEKIPFRWLPPEALKYNEFSTKSDVYAYGVTVWEIALDCSAEPFQDFDLPTLRTHISNGGTLPMDYIHPTLATIIRGCTQVAPDCRPTFLAMAELCAIELSENQTGLSEIIAREYAESGEIRLVRPKPDMSSRPLPPAPLPSIGSADEIIYETTDSNSDDVGPLRLSKRYTGMRGGFYEDSHIYSSSMLSGKGPIDRHVSFNSVNCDSDANSGIKGLHNINIRIRPNRGGCRGVWSNPNGRKRLLCAGLLLLLLLLIAIVPALIYFVIIPASKDSTLSANTGSSSPKQSPSPEPINPTEGQGELQTIPHGRQRFVMKLFDTTTNTTSNSCFDGSQFSSCDKAMRFRWRGNNLAAIGSRGYCLANMRGTSTTPACSEGRQSGLFCQDERFLGIDVLDFNQANNCTGAPEWELALIRTLPNHTATVAGRGKDSLHLGSSVKIGRHERGDVDWMSREERQKRRQDRQNARTKTTSATATDTTETTDNDTEDETMTAGGDVETTLTISSTPSPSPEIEQSPSPTHPFNDESTSTTTVDVRVTTIATSTVAPANTGSATTPIPSNLQVVALRDITTKELVKLRHSFVNGKEVRYLLLRGKRQRNVAHLVLEEITGDRRFAR